MDVWGPHNQRSTLLCTCTFHSWFEKNWILLMFEFAATQMPYLEALFVVASLIAKETQLHGEWWSDWWLQSERRCSWWVPWAVCHSTPCAPWDAWSCHKGRDGWLLPSLQHCFWRCWMPPTVCLWATSRISMWAPFGNIKGRDILQNVSTFPFLVMLWL